MRKLLPVVMLGAFCCWNAHAYEEPFHEDMTLEALMLPSSELTTDLLKSLGLKEFGLESGRQQFRTSTNQQKSIAGLIVFGSSYEDALDEKQALRHFWNPLDGSPLNLPIVGTSRSEPSPGWALEDQTSYELQQFSYQDARGYLLQALTAPTKTQRDRNWGLLFQTLGHVGHHMQDMAQPQHVRNDPHCDDWKCWAGGIFTHLFIQYDLHHPSGYERWTTAHPPAPSVFARYGAAYSSVGAQGEGFAAPRAFWSTTPGSVDGTGIGEYTNRGFFSVNTLNSYARPEVLRTYSMDLAVVCSEEVAKGRPGCPSSISTEKISFGVTYVTDTLRPPLSTENLRAFTVSIYDEDLERAGYAPVRSLNRFTYDAAMDFLVERAVGYTAGLFNYFFRGKLIIEAPKPQYVFALADQMPPTPSSPQGFDQIKVAVKNATPDLVLNGIPTPQEMSAGELIAVARFHRDMCFTPDPTSGVYYTPGPSLVCQSPEEEIVVSNPVIVGDPASEPGAFTMPSGTSPAETATFEFPSGRIPINATDLVLQLVYQGTLGDEQNAVVVQTLDIAEPTLVDASNDLDYYFDSEGVVRRAADQPGYDPEGDTLQSVSFFFGRDEFPVTLGSEYSISGRVAPGEHVGVWALVRKDEDIYYGTAYCPSCGYPAIGMVPRRVETDDDGTLLRSPQPYFWRGYYNNNGTTIHTTIPAAAGCTGTLAECISRFPAYSPLGPVGHVNVVY